MAVVAEVFSNPTRLFEHVEPGTSVHVLNALQGPGQVTLLPCRIGRVPRQIAIVPQVLVRLEPAAARR